MSLNSIRAGTKERLLKKQPEPIHGFDEIYAVVMRAGEAATPTVTLGFLAGDSVGACSIRGEDLAKRIARHLGEAIKLRVEVWWNARTFEVENLIVHDLLEWRDVHLAEVYREYGNRLPVTLTVSSVEELMVDRDDDRND